MFSINKSSKLRGSFEDLPRCGEKTFRRTAAHAAEKVFRRFGPVSGTESYKGFSAWLSYTMKLSGMVRAMFRGSRRSQGAKRHIVTYNSCLKAMIPWSGVVYQASFSVLPTGRTQNFCKNRLRFQQNHENGCPCPADIKASKISWVPKLCLMEGQKTVHEGTTPRAAAGRGGNFLYRIYLAKPGERT